MTLVLFVAPGLNVAIVHTLNRSLKGLCKKEVHEICSPGFDGGSL